MYDMQVSVQGNVAQPPRTFTTRTGDPMTTFRMAATPRIRKEGEWTDGSTSYFTVTCFRALAESVASSLQVGHPVVVTGRLSVKTWENAAGKGTDVEIDATAVGHDLTKGTSAFVARSKRRADEPAQPTATADARPTDESWDAAPAAGQRETAAEHAA